jgi:hypothetical protein
VNCKVKFVHSSCNNSILCSFSYSVKCYLILRYQPCVIIFSCLSSRWSECPSPCCLVQEHGFDVHECNKNGWTALHLASRNGHLHIVRELIEKINVDVFTTKLVWCLLFAYLNTQQSLVPYHDLYTPPYIIPSLYIQTLVLSGIK